jgi:hypothetical protein
MSKEEKIYVGSGKKVKDYDLVNISVCLDDRIKPYIYEYKGKKYINLTVAAKKEVDQYGKSHYVAINTFKPDEKKVETKEENDDLPF